MSAGIRQAQRKGLRELLIAKALFCGKKISEANYPRQLQLPLFLLGGFLGSFLLRCHRCCLLEFWNLPLKVVELFSLAQTSCPRCSMGSTSIARYCGYLPGMSTKIVKNYLAQPFLW